MEYMRFSIPCSNRVQLGIAAAHGASDAGKSPELLMVYALALMPIPGPVVTAGFAVSSLLHFAGDVGLAGSLALHASLAGMAVFSIERATRALFVYMNYVHIPIIIFKLLICGSYSSLYAMLYTMLFFARNRLPKLDQHGRFEFGHRMQLVVMCHVILSYI
jgi:hypothetical protein